ncbi:TlpA disulfide reductase family protein [Ichthyenterobacterium sp. W332]|uniref:TlpA disulfide reductase family protein n=1 Tax=Microcosmobacter mediterraneus TaxID=3075607 RepID=A0ABU2YHK2_9FLAO|nr:TlpA disulfide reductase family protein [Ichthyenterobacterium sp. W332]MDT0557647.1 TlpA disulfide reductase family protein [Ichthyenterobacterium sp. W332]
MKSIKTIKKYLIVTLALLCISCKQESKAEHLKVGIYRAVLQVQDNKELPFNFEIADDNSVVIYNAEERIKDNQLTYKNDSIYITFPVYEGYIAGTVKNGVLQGHYIKESLDRVVPFNAEIGSKRFEINERKSKFNISGNWETVFSKDIEGDEYIAKGIFTQNGNVVNGTFRTTTGDYRFLEGVLNGNQLSLSAFDGAHAFLFTANVTDSTMEGQFYSGNHWKEPFVAKINPDYELPDSDSLTYLKEGYDKFAFSFPDENGKIVSLQDERFKDKVVLVQIMGTWCPNCLDESRFYSEYYKNNSNEDIEIVALAFEYAKTKDRALTNIRRLRDNTEITYPILLAQIGSSDKGKANEKLPMLNHVLSYPTTIYIDKKGNVRKIHTGFNGPATGDKYNMFISEFDSFVKMLLLE